MFPRDNNCQDSLEKASPVGLAVDKNQQVYLDWLRQVGKAMAVKLDIEEKRIIKTMN